MYEAGHTSVLVTATADAPLLALRVPAAEIGKLRELGLTLTAATATRLGLTRATTVSITPSGGKPGRNTVFGAADSGIQIFTGWATAPVISTNYLRRCALPASIGAGLVWSWPADDPLLMGDGEAICELVLANLVAVAPSTFELWAKWGN